MEPDEGAQTFPKWLAQYSVFKNWYSREPVTILDWNVDSTKLKVVFRPPRKPFSNSRPQWFKRTLFFAHWINTCHIYDHIFCGPKSDGNLNFQYGLLQLIDIKSYWSLGSHPTYSFPLFELAMFMNFQIFYSNKILVSDNGWKQPMNRKRMIDRCTLNTRHCVSVRQGK